MSGCSGLASSALTFGSEAARCAAACRSQSESGDAAANLRATRTAWAQAPSGRKQPCADVEDLYCRGDYVVIRVGGNDPDGDPLTYRIDPADAALPTGLSLERKSGRISGVLTALANAG